MAAYLGCAFSFAHFITDQGGVEVMAAYRDRFRPSAHLAAPLGSIGLFVLCADTEAEAQRLTQSRDLWRLRLDQGYLGAVPSIVEITDACNLSCPICYADSGPTRQSYRSLSEIEQCLTS